VIPRFRNYLIFYSFDGTEIHLLHIFHGRTDYDPAGGADENE